MNEQPLFQPPWNFFGLSKELSDPARARAWVLPIPYESTTSYGAGTRNGPAAIIAASRQIERFDRELDCEPSAEVGIHTMESMAPVRRSPDAMVEAIEAAVTQVWTGSPAPSLLAVLGGEHTISPGVVRGLVRALSPSDLVAVQVDAHADLRDSFEGSAYSHGCAARRILEVCPLFQIGIRSLCAEEEQFRRTSDRVRTVFAEEITQGRAFLGDLAEFVRGKTVYLTIDLDGLDPSIMPAVGTPEPEGLSWPGVLDVVRTVCRHCAALPAFDVVELAPISAIPGPDFLAAKLVYKIISLVLVGRAGPKGTGTFFGPKRAEK